MRSVEERQLSFANDLLDEAAADVSPDTNRTDARLTVLEAVAAAWGGWDLTEFWAFPQAGHCEIQSDPKPWADKILASVADTPIPLPLALSALSREVLPQAQQRKTGAYYTDWRLAELVAKQSVPKVRGPGPWIDTACGTGMLLVAATMAVPAQGDRDEIIRDKLIGSDLSARALRGALLAVASLTSELTTVSSFAKRLFLQDSLRSRDTWTTVAPQGAALLIGNPPWEKLKASRHELAASQGAMRHYGQGYADEVDLTMPRQRLLAYIEAVASGTRLQGGGEHDLYKLFLELGMGLAADGGVLALLLPAGLIRSQGTETLRRALIAAAPKLSVSVIENRASHFAIDTRFKFLCVVGQIGSERPQPISLKVADRSGSLPAKSVKLKRADLSEIRSDLSIPEVKSAAEWDLFTRLTRNSVAVGDPTGPWRPTYRREVDMTSDRKTFQRGPGKDTIPLLEGRHVAQYRWRAKTYQSGEGRAAAWRPETLKTARLQTQWFVPLAGLAPTAAERVNKSRVGFCDITGQTNERSLLLARIPAGVVCGNKVPTLAFAAGGARREDLFLALANSFVVDWMMRRVVTTTVNFFLLDSLPLPRLDEASPVGHELVQLAAKITAAEGNPSVDPWLIGQWRARSDALVAAAWGLSLDDMAIVLNDFPLIDRGQPALEIETRSTVTADAVLAELSKLYGASNHSVERLGRARKLRAVPYIPAEYVKEFS